MRITWVVSALISQSPTGELTSDLASARYRVLIPGLILASRHTLNIVTINEKIDVNAVREVVDADIVIISKSFSDKSERLAKRAIAAGIPVVLDICDDHFSTPQLQAHYQSMCRLATHVVASTEAMVSVIEKNTGRTATIIPDPYEMQQASPHFGGSDNLNLLWFGHPVNLDSLLDFLPQLNELKTDLPVNLNIVTASSPEIKNLISNALQNIKRPLNVKLISWSMQEMKGQFAAADVVIIPSLDNQKKLVKSPNRIIEALWSGCYVVAGEVPSYQSFSNWAWVENDLIAGLHEAINNCNKTNQNIIKAQEYISREHSPEVVAGAWEACLNDVIENSAIQPAVTVTDSLMYISSGMEDESSADLKKLNLGCGDKILPGFINVDVVEARAGMRPDVLCDLHDLSPFEDNSVDEILSVHVVEHFWRWEVIDILKEWARVLKPGGKMILECPNLISACETFLQDPDHYSGEGPEGQRTMWVFYGDPKWKDPLMNHRWAYTPKSLAQTMADAGLVNMHQAAAQFKLREPRDMRIVGFKPK